jgi:hypothetical protein
MPWTPHFDLIMAVRTMVGVSPIKWQFCHIRGHQDDEPGQTLDRWAELNIKMDNLAKVFWELQQQHPPPLRYRVRFEPCSVWIRDWKICINVREIIYNWIHGNIAHEWWAHKQ